MLNGHIDKEGVKCSGQLKRKLLNHIFHMTMRAMNLGFVTSQRHSLCVHRSVSYTRFTMIVYNVEVITFIDIVIFTFDVKPTVAVRF